MTIEVVYKSGRRGFVTAEMLDFLLDAGDIQSFRRCDGWVRPECDRIRRRGIQVISLPERRSRMNSLFAADAPLPFERHP